MPTSGPRNYTLITDKNGNSVFGSEDGTQYYGGKAYNVATISNANQDGSSGNVADLGVHDNDNLNANAPPNWYSVNLGAASPSTDTKITFPSTIHLLTIDNTRNASSVYYELADTAAASATSVQIPPETLAVIACNTTVVHIWTAANPVASSLVMRGQ